MLDWFVPPDLATWVAVSLLLVSILTAFITTALGIGGGVLLLAIMTVFLPPAIMIPVHGVIQLGANTGRMLITWRRIRWGLLLPFLAGGVMGAGLGAQLLVELQSGWMELALGAFIVWSCIGPQPRLHQASRAGLALGGAATSALTLFVGATGPLVGALLRALRLDRREHVATFSACMVGQHSLKALVFGLAGFGFGPYAAFIAAMIAFGVVGTWLGSLVLERMNDRLFHRLLTVLLLLLACRLLYVGVRDVLSSS